MKFFCILVLASLSAIALSSTNLCVESSTNYIQQVPKIFKQLRAIISNKLGNDNDRETLQNLLQTVRFSKTVQLANMSQNDQRIIIEDLPKFKTHYFSESQVKDLLAGGDVDFKL